jgi:hypothetical protein
MWSKAYSGNRRWQFLRAKASLEATLLTWFQDQRLKFFHCTLMQQSDAMAIVLNLLLCTCVVLRTLSTPATTGHTHQQEQ